MGNVKISKFIFHPLFFINNFLYKYFSHFYDNFIVGCIFFFFCYLDFGSDDIMVSGTSDFGKKEGNIRL